MTLKNWGIVDVAGLAQVPPDPACCIHISTDAEGTVIQEHADSIFQVGGSGVLTDIVTLLQGAGHQATQLTGYGSYGPDCTITTNIVIGFP